MAWLSLSLTKEALRGTILPLRQSPKAARSPTWLLRI